MEWKKNVNTNLGITIILVFAALFTIVDFYVICAHIDGYPFTDLNGTVAGEDKDNSFIEDKDVVDDNGVEVIEQSELTDIIDDQLSIFYGKKSLNDITNQRKLSLAFNLMKKKSGNIAETFTKEELESAFNSSIISNLGIEHENIIPVKSSATDGNPGYGYTYNNGIYDDFVYTYSSDTSAFIIYHKVVSFNELDGKYTLSVKYLWGGYCEYLMDCPYVYNSYHDSINNQNSITKIPDDVVFGSTEELDNWGKENFSIYESQLEKYNFVFVKENGKINLVDFYVD